jgi:DnaJ-class molecular chaperone
MLHTLDLRQCIQFTDVVIKYVSQELPKLTVLYRHYHGPRPAYNINYEIDLYACLGIRSDATVDEIKKAFRRLARQYHPDKNRGNEAAAEKMKEVNLSYEILSTRRDEYDDEVQRNFLWIHLVPYVNSTTTTTTISSRSSSSSSSSSSCSSSSSSCSSSHDDDSEQDNDQDVKDNSYELDSIDD